MRKTLLVVAMMLVVCIGWCFFAVAEDPQVDLSVLSLAELNQIKSDIAVENNLHHETNSIVEDAVLNVVKAETEKYYSERGITVSWAWYGWEYNYSRNMD